MFTIGDFANLGRVSIRMLRHYDSIGVLCPAAVDPVNGYRLYNANQLSRLNRVVALKELGFTLAQVNSILTNDLGPAEIRGMLTLRRAQLQAQLESDQMQLTGIEARLRIIEREGTMSTQEIVLKEVPAVRLAEMTTTAASFRTSEIGPAIQALYPQLMQHLGQDGVPPAGYGIAYYEQAPDDSVVIHAGVVVNAADAVDKPYTIGTLVGTPQAATTIHHGSMDTCEDSYQAIAQWIEANGYRSTGYAREVYLDYDPDNTANGVTELQIPVEKD